MASNSTLVGWQDPPGTRGTFDILKTCIGTVILLCWSTVPANVPSQRGGWWQQYRGKVALFLWSLLGPDFTFIVAMGQLNEAYRTKRKMTHREGGAYSNWTLRQSFFLNMGGLHLRFTDSATSCPRTIPVTCRQLLHVQSLTGIRIDLAKAGNDISVEEIEARNKLDGLARLIAIIQSTWFTIESLGRVAQGLFLTTLELTTLGFVVAMTACSICWWKKPIDVSRPIIIDVDIDLPSIVAAAVTNGKEYDGRHGRTPLSFLDRNEGHVSRAFQHYVQMLRTLRLIPGHQTRPQEDDCFASIEFPEFDFSFGGVVAIGGLLYMSIFMGAWNYHFPSHLELVLWRIASVYTIVAGVLVMLVGGFYEVPAVRASCRRRWSRITRALRHSDKGEKEKDNATELDPADTEEGHQSSRQKRKGGRLVRNLRNNSPEQDPALDMPLGFFVPFTIISALYCLSRLYILVEEFAELRALPPSAYQTVNYGTYSAIL